MKRYDLLYIATFLILVSLCGCGTDKDSGKSAAQKTVKAQITEVKRYAIPTQHSFPGRVKSKVSIVLAAKMPGYVKSVPNEIGDFVKKGALLVGLDDTDIKAKIQAVTESERALRREKAAVAARLLYAKQSFTRFKNLYKEASATKDEFDRARAERDALSSREAALEAQIARAGADLREAKNQLAYVNIKAPADGWITSREVDSGAFVTPGMPLIRFNSADEGAWFAAGIDESLISEVRPGTPVSIVIPAQGLSIQTSLAQVTPRSNRVSHTFPVLADISKYHPKSGLFGRIYIYTGRVKQVLIPYKAVIDRGGIRGVYTVDKGNGTHWRVIKTGRLWINTGHGFRIVPSNATRNNDLKAVYAEVLTGLSPGEKIVISNLNRVSEGCRIE